ncbi:MAG: DegT/DnrJ/EryC1/StrS family aminotransferase, partial [Spirochaetia bacterium]|nr:DegT/DnrJ/EryC1/StrS family aminotransferase [Spirochaetia bacterium]
SFYEYLSGNRSKIEEWINSEDPFWDTFIEESLKIELEKSSIDKNEIIKRRNLIKSKIQFIGECNLFQFPPIPHNSIPKNGFDILSSSFCAESITENEDEFLYAIHSLLSMISQNGNILLTMIKNAESYRAGNSFFPAFPVDENKIHSILEKSGFVGIKIQTCNAEHPDQGYQGLMGIFAEKKGRPVQTPVIQALEKHQSENVVSFHVPGHKGGKWNWHLSQIFGKGAEFDLNAMDGLDDLSRPSDAIMKAQNLAASLFGARTACFELNGATGGIHAMLLSSLNPGDTLIMQRNSHRSAFSALVLGGIFPAYLPAGLNSSEGVLEPVSPEEVEQTIRENPDAKAVMIISPDYYGQNCNIRSIADACRKYGKLLLVDESHGSHFYFHPFYPGGAVANGADVSVVSIHKTAGSLTQSAFLLISEHAPSYISDWIDDIHLLLRSTSASYLLMAGLDLARSNLEKDGYAGINRSLSLSKILRKNLQGIRTVRIMKSNAVFQDPARAVLVHENENMNGFSLENLLRKKFGIQVEMSSHMHNILILTGGNSINDIRSLTDALKKIDSETEFQKRNQVFSLFNPKNNFPESAYPPHEAFYKTYELCEISQSEGRVCAEFIMLYPPGIPLIVPGEVINSFIIEKIKIMKENNVSLHGMADHSQESIRVMKNS